MDGVSSSKQPTLTNLNAFLIISFLSDMGICATSVGLGEGSGVNISKILQKWFTIIENLDDL